MSNIVLDVIKGRRSVHSFKDTPVEGWQLEAVLEAGRWAPSYLNLQPWRFIVTTDMEVKRRLAEHAPTVFSKAVVEAPVVISIVVDSEKDSLHFVEDGANAAQNMALAAYSLGLGSCWIGVFNPRSKKGTSESELKHVLDIPDRYRLIAMLPIGVPSGRQPVSDRKPLSELICHETFC